MPPAKNDAAPARPSTRQQSFARAISIVGHPMLLVPGAIVLALAGRVSAGEATAILGVVLGSILIVAVYIVRGVRAGKLSHIDISKREERGGFYRVTTLALAVAAAILHLTHAPRGAVNGTGVTFVLILVASVVNRWIKASLHTAFAIVAAGIAGVGTRSTPITLAFALAATAVGWSRIVLNRHTPPEVAVGAVLGLLAGAALFIVG